MKTAKLTYNAILAAIICILAPFSLHVGAVPVSLATFAVFIISALSKPKNSVICIIIYILLGAIGLPVFSGFLGGFQQIAGLTGGYIIGYIPCAAVVSFIINRFENKKASYPIAMALGTVTCCFCGTAWYMYQTKTNFATAFSVCILPFILGDTIKIAVASILAYGIKPRIKKFI